MKRLSVYTMIVGCVTLLSCDKAVEPPTTGGITLRIVMGSDGGSASAAAASQETQSSRPHLDSALVILTGPTPKTVSVTPPTNVTIDGLSAGLYGVALEGWQNDEVVFAGRVTGVQVVAGQDNAVTDALLIPTTLSFSAVGETRQLDGPTGTSWLSSNEIVATVDATTGLVTAVSNGEATITGTLASATAEATAAVAQQVAAVTVTPATDTLIALGRMAQLTATATDSHGNSVSGAAFTWRSSDEAAATVNATGLVTSVAAGSVTITATSEGVEGVSGSLKMRVVEADLTGIRDLLVDLYVLRLIAQVNENTAARLRDALLEVALSVTQGNLAAVHSALTTAQSEVMASADANENDVVLFAVLRLVFDHAERLLNL